MAYTSSRKWPNHFPQEKINFKSKPKTSLQTDKVVFHSFSIGDADDPMLMASYPVMQWQETEQGKWCCENAEGDIYLQSMADPITFGYKLVIVGELSEANHTYFKLKWAAAE